MASFLGWNTQKGSIKFNKPNAVNADALTCGHHKGADWLMGDPWKEWFLGGFTYGSFQHCNGTGNTVSSVYESAASPAVTIPCFEMYLILGLQSLCLAGARCRHQRCLSQLIHCNCTNTPQPLRRNNHRTSRVGRNPEGSSSPTSSPCQNSGMDSVLKCGQDLSPTPSEWWIQAHNINGLRQKPLAHRQEPIRELCWVIASGYLFQSISYIEKNSHIKNLNGIKGMWAHICYGAD